MQNTIIKAVKKNLEHELDQYIFSKPPSKIKKIQL